MTDTLRKYDAGTTRLGPVTGKVETRWGRKYWRKLRVPPRQKAWELRSDCMVNDMLRTQNGMMTKSVIFATRAHGHLNMRSAYMEHYKPNRREMTKDKDFGVVRKFDYNFQPAVYVDGNGFEVEQGDMIRFVMHALYFNEHEAAYSYYFVGHICDWSMIDRILIIPLLQCCPFCRSHCIYSTEENSQTVYGGIGTEDEMCLFYVFHYPIDVTMDRKCIDWNTYIEHDIGSNPFD